jgi:23S rRNA pseudoU1915 N3-methylase RlmH
MTKQERINQWEKKIKQIVGNYKRLSAACDEANEAGCLDTDGKLHTAIWLSFDLMMVHIDQQEWLEWYIYDNDCGSKKMEAGYDSKLSKITTPRQLAKLIVEDENRNANQTKP